VRFGVLYHPGCTLGGEYFVPISRGGVVECNVAWHLSPLYEVAEALDEAGCADVSDEGKDAL